MSEYISREELLEKEKYLSDWNIDLHYIDSEDVKTIPSADVRPNIHGEWIFYDEEFYQQGRFANVAHRIRECSICHHKIADFVGNMDFCPNCGADMREPKGEKET